MEDWTYFAPIENAELDQSWRDEFSIACQAQEDPGQFASGKESNNLSVDLDGEEWLSEAILANPDFDEAEFKTFCQEYLFGESGNQNHETLALILQEIEMSITKSASEDALLSRVIEESVVLSESWFENVTMNEQVLSAEKDENAIRPVESFTGENIPSELQINYGKVDEPVYEEAFGYCELNHKPALNASSNDAVIREVKKDDQRNKFSRRGICMVCVNKRREKMNIYSHKQVHTSMGEAVAVEYVDGVATIVSTEKQNPCSMIKNKLKYGCDKCEFSTEKWPNMKKHKTTHLPRTIECNQCNRKYSTKERLKVHFQACHSLKYECANCKQTGMSRNKWHHHNCLLLTN